VAQFMSNPFFYIQTIDFIMVLADRVSAFLTSHMCP